MNGQRRRHLFFRFFDLVRNKPWYEPFRRAFWSNPDRLMAVKATLAISMLVIPFVLAGRSFFAVTLALGAVAGALSETDDHPRGRIKSLLLKTGSFAVSSLAVELLRPYPLLLGVGLAVSTIGFILIGGLSERFRGITFGAILVGIYAMLGAEISPAWYLQPILLPAGALFYGLFSLLLLYYRPWRLLDEQLARGFLALSKYLDEKANLFPSDEKMQGEIRNRLALLNVQLVGALDRTKEILNSYSDALKDEASLKPYLRYFMLLQSLHERAASSHERYDRLSQDPGNRQLMEGIGQLLHQLSRATRKFAESLLTGIPYHHPEALAWTVNVLNEQLARQGTTETHPLALLISNLSRSNTSLQNLDEDHQRTLVPRLEKDSRSMMQRLKDQLSWNHPRLRYAIRLSLCFLVGFAISEAFDLTKGVWIILTSLFVCQPSYSETRRRLFQRVLGTLCGVISGVIIIQLLPTMPGQLLLMLVSAYVFFTWLRRKYSISVIFITIFVLCAFNLISHHGVALMLPRLADTLIGSALAIISVRLLWPDWQYKRLPPLLNEAIAKNTAYFQAILEAYRHPINDDDLAYRIARRQAHRADNALALSWQDMQMEPRQQRQSREDAFTLTYLNHAFLSYLSALGAHREQQHHMNPEILIVANEILEALLETNMTPGKGESKKNIRTVPILEQIRHRMTETNPGILKQQFILLYNIAEVTGQLIEQANRFRKPETGKGRNR